MRTTMKAFTSSLFLFCLMPALTVAQVYYVTDLGPLAPTAINSWGQVVGNYNGHAFVWTRFAGSRDLGLLLGGRFSNAAAITDFGVVTGTADGSGTVVSRILVSRVNSVVTSHNPSFGHTGTVCGAWVPLLPPSATVLPGLVQ